MKKLFLYSVMTAALVFFGACSSLPFDSSESSAWAAGGQERTRGSIQIVSVSADKAGEWGSLEKEVLDLLPLLFFEESYIVVSSPGEADYSVDVKLREREYPEGWQTRRSLSAEVRIWAAGSAEPLPLSAGRSLMNGKQSLSSSKTLSVMLRKAVKNAVNGLPRISKQSPGDK